QSFCHRFCFEHDLGCQGASLRATHNLREGCTRERTNRVESHAAHKLYPHLASDVTANWAPQPRLDERPGDAPAAFAFGAVRLAQGKAHFFDVLDDTGFDDAG